MRVWDRKLGPEERILLSLVASLLCLPAVFAGLVLDDYFIAMRVLDDDGGPRLLGLLDAFVFVAKGEIPALIENGRMPWWSDPSSQLAPFRPFSALTHLVDYWLLQAPWLMHVQSLFWLFLLNVTMGAWYARLFSASPRVLTLAFLLFAFAPGHGFAASWLANRNACLAALCALLCLLAHERARAGGGARFVLLSLVALALSLLSGEMGIATMGLLVAHAACLDADTVHARLVALLPAALVCCAYVVAYRLLGHGTHGSPLYVSPLDDPLRFARAALLHIPILAFGQFWLPVLSLTIMLQRSAAIGFAIASVALFAILGPALLRTLRSDARARFCALSMLLALLPVSATAPHDRLLLIADVGGLGLVALVCEGAAQHLRAARVLRFVVHTRVFASLLLMPAYAASLYQYDDLVKIPLSGLLRDDALAGKTAVFVNAPCAYFPALLPWIAARDGRPAPSRLRSLLPGVYPLEVQRVDAHTLRVHVEGGILQPPGTWRAPWPEQPGPISPVYLAQALNQVAGPVRPFQAGDRFALSDLEVVIEAVTPEGWPSLIRFRFALALDDPSLLWLRWHEGKFARFTLPRQSAAVRLPPVFR